MKEFFVGFISALITAALYLTGYGYVHGYYQYHGISVNELELGFPEVLVRAFFVIWRLWTGPEFERVQVLESFAIVVLLSAFFYFAIFRILTDLKNYNMPVKKPRLTALGLVLSLATIIVATSSSFVGAWVAKEQLRALPRAKIVAERPPANLADYIESDDWGVYYLESSSSTHFFVVRRNKLDFRWLVRVPVSQDLVVQHFHQ